MYIKSENRKNSNYIKELRKTYKFYQRTVGKYKFCQKVTKTQICQMMKKLNFWQRIVEKMEMPSHDCKKHTFCQRIVEKAEISPHDHEKM